MSNLVDRARRERLFGPTARPLSFLAHCWAVAFRRRWLVLDLAVAAVIAVLLAPPLNTGHAPGPGETPTPYPPPSSGRNGH